MGVRRDSRESRLPRELTRCEVTGRLCPGRRGRGWAGLGQLSLRPLSSGTGICARFADTRGAPSPGAVSWVRV